MLRKTRLIRDDPDARVSRWYEVELAEPVQAQLFCRFIVTTHWGRIGQKTGRGQVREFGARPAAEEYFDKQVASKERRGYRVVDSDELWVRHPGCTLCRLVDTGQDDPCFVADFPQSSLFLNWDQSYRGRSMLVFKNHIPDFFGLSNSDILAGLRYIRVAERAIRAALAPEKMNYLFMGNREGHVHLHLVPRYPDDPNYGNAPRLNTETTLRPQQAPDEYREVATLIRASLLGTLVATTRPPPVP